MLKSYQQLSIAIIVFLLCAIAATPVVAQEKELSEEELIQQLQERDKKVKQKLEVIEKIGGNKEQSENNSNTNSNEKDLEDLSEEELINELGDNKQRIKRQLDTIKKAFDKDKPDAENSGSLTSTEEFDRSLPAYAIISIAAIIGVCAFPVIKYGGRSLIWGEESIAKNLVEQWQSKFGKPQVPTGVAYRHNEAFEKLSKIGTKLAKLDKEKFDNKEFLLFVRIVIAFQKGNAEDRELYNSAQLLHAGIVTQQSFLRLEQTELRYRSSQQQKFYNFVADKLNENLDQKEFKNLVQQKVSEIAPRLNTQEGKNALSSYYEELNLISEHELGLKLLAQFKQSELADFSVLRSISEIVNQLKGMDLLSPESLVGVIIENFETFHKIAPIIEISPEQREPQIFAIVLQYVGLIERHSKSYTEFKQILLNLRKWQNPYQLLTTIRNEYTADNYRLPKEFKQDIPGEYVYKKYEEYLNEKLAKKENS